MKMSRSYTLCLGLGILGLLLTTIVIPGFAEQRQWEREGAFIRAVANGNEVQVEKYLSEGVSPDLTDVGQACRSRNSTVNLKMRGTPVLESAVYWQRLGVARLLLKHGADINSRDPNRQTPLMWAVLYPITEKTTPMVKLLLEFHPDVHAVDQFGCTAMQIAQKQHHTEVVRLLVAYEAKQ